MIIDVSAKDGDGGIINTNAIIDAVGAIGDYNTTEVIMVVHPVVLGSINKLNLIDWAHFDQRGIKIDSFKKIRLMTNNSAMTARFVPAVDGGSPAPGYTKYYSYILGPGAIDFGYGLPNTPLAFERDAAGCNGAGMETIFSRVEWAIHPKGYKFTTERPSLDDLKDGTKWTRVWDRRRIPFAAIISRG
ncbi:MAG: hypothetical protein LBO66_13480 [Deltaproteobacteria bacterium]|jgi:hypothetical protein|nr:hypothetical protein [Deltaproteobacteria bacterium]